MNLRFAPWLATVTLIGGCGLIFHYDDYQDRDTPDGGPGGNSGSTGTGGFTGSTSSTGTGGSTGSTSSTGTGGSTGSTSSTGTGGSTGSTSSTTGTGGAGSCDTTETCVPYPPSGWNGPIVLEVGSPSPGCTETGWTVETPWVKGGTAYAATGGCTCSCGAPSGGTCPDAAAVKEFGVSYCGGIDWPGTATTTCAKTTGQPLGAIGLPTDATGATCSPSTPTPANPAVFTEWAQGCSSSSTNTCQGSCVKSGSNLCVYAQGTPDCPPAYPKKTPVYGQITDTRTCSPCVCTVSGRQCQPTTALYMDDYCNTGAFLDNVPHNGSSCVTETTPIGSMKVVNPGTPSGGQCDLVDAGVISGTPELGGTMTVCCQS